ncbi:MAG: hypothetical protein ACLPV8_25695 [Steroidobacteraceae bacterium]
MIGRAVWMAIGIVAGAWKTRGFKSNLVDFELLPDALPDAAPVPAP